MTGIVDRLGERDRRLDVEALQHAVARDVGVDDRGDAGVLEAAAEIERRHVGRVAPSPRPRRGRRARRCRRRRGRETAARPRARNPGSSTAAVPMMTRATPFSSQPATVSMSRMPPPSCTFIVTRGENALDRRRRSSACRRRRRRDRRRADSRNPAAANAARLRGRVGVEHRRLRHVAAHQAHAFAVLEVDGGKEDHGRHLRKLAISARPSVWLFSGWNCVPTILSRATIAVIGPP